ncbi:MAG: hypothetical protein ACERKO_11555, partial [Acetanaerobacterium sp.]
MNNKGNGTSQTWYTYAWNNRTIMDSVKSTIHNVMAGSNHALAMISDQVYGWGAADKKQLGSAAQSAYPVPLTQINTLIDNQTAAGVSLTDIFVAGNSNYLTFDDGSVWVWGDNSYNKSGASGAPVNIDTPTQVTALQDKQVVKVVAGRNTNYYITEDGDIYASGSNMGGVTGLGEEYAGEATIDMPTKLDTIGYSETLTPPTSPVQITVPDTAKANSTIEVVWNAVSDAARYELNRTVVLMDPEPEGEDTPAEDMLAKPEDVEISTMAFIPKDDGVGEILLYLSTSNGTPQMVYSGDQTTFSDTAAPEWQSVSYELKAVNRIGDYSQPVLSSAVPIITADIGGDDDNNNEDNTGGDATDDNTGSGTDDDADGDAGNNTDTNRDVIIPPINVTVNPPEITMQSPDITMQSPDIDLRSPDISVQAPDISLSYPELQSSNGTANATTAQQSGYSWVPTPEQLARLGLSFGGSSNAPYVITIEPSAP